MSSKHRPKHALLSLAFCGYSNSGKTTLIEQIVRRLSKSLAIAYAKHDGAHAIRPIADADTTKIFAAGAQSVMIVGAEESLRHDLQPLPRSLWLSEFGEVDLLLIEGWKFEAGPKVLVLDEAGLILEDLRAGKISDVLAIVGSNRPDGCEFTWFHRDDVEGLAQFVQNWSADRIRPIIHGLVLAGGHSRRMQSDKALLRYRALTQVEHCVELLSPYCNQTFISCRSGQFDGTPAEVLQQLPDRFVGFGPLGGILTAFEFDSQAAWLIVACDLPRLDLETIMNLIQQRDPSMMATCYVDPQSQLAEPLCAIYEPRIRSMLFRYIQAGVYCPRKILMNVSARRILPPSPRALENVNYPADYLNARRDIEMEQQA
jgi:molybdopterin-guanine dinucleotide biosynthesis protein MobB